MRPLAFVVLVLVGCSSATSSSPLPPLTPLTTLTTLTTGPSPPSSPHRSPGLPDPSITPGASDDRVTQATIASTICVTGYTKTVRPDASYTDALKARQMVAYHRVGSARGYEEDHLIALEIGGHPTDPRNLWPEPRAGPPGTTAADKDRVENAAHAAVCSGRLGLADAQRAMATDWQSLGRDLGAT